MWGWLTMLDPDGKPEYPDWAAPYTASWQDGQWIVVFTGEEAAKYALRILLSYDGAPALAAAPLPDHFGTYWYVGVKD